jgi:hypothetical protein
MSVELVDGVGKTTGFILDIIVWHWRLPPSLAQGPHFNGRKIRRPQSRLTKYSLPIIAGHAH